MERIGAANERVSKAIGEEGFTSPFCVGRGGRIRGCEDTDLKGECMVWYENEYSMRMITEKRSRFDVDGELTNFGVFKPRS